MENIFDTKPYRTSRSAYTVQCAFDYFFQILITDAFLAKVLKDIGLSDSLTGILSSVISVSFLFQLLVIPLIGRLGKVRKTVIILDTLSQIMYTGIYAVPFIPVGFSVKAFLVTVMIVLGYLFLYLNQQICYKWGNSFVSPEKRGIFSNTKELISLLSGVVVTLAAGAVMDRFEAKGNIHFAFIIIGAGMVLICIMNFISLANIQDARLVESEKKHSLREIIENTVDNKNFRSVIILSALSCCATYVMIGFMGTYKIIDLKFSIVVIQIINIVSCLARAVISRPFGRYSDKKGYANGFFLGQMLLVIGIIFGMCTTNIIKWLIVPFTMLYHMSQAGTSNNIFNMAYCYVEEEYIVHAMIINNSIKGVAGFIASLAGGKILSFVQSRGSVLFGMQIYGQQLLCLIATVLAAAASVYCKKVVCRQKEEKK